MEMKFADNLKKLRKERSLTREQLAEAIGVTVGAVYKWENDRSIPEILTLMRLADLFGVSIDALVGFAVQNGGVTALRERVRDLGRGKRYGDAISEAEKALLRYPNDFTLVYELGELYFDAGLEGGKKKYLYRAIELLEHSMTLISQNTDPKISEVSVMRDIAQCHISLGKIKKGLDILKEHNISGVHNALIANTVAGTDPAYMKEHGFALDDAVPYMVSAFGDIVTNTFRTVMSYANYYDKKRDYASSRRAILWLIGFFESIKCDEDSVAYVDKIIAPCYAECAVLSFLLSETESVELYLREACRVAEKYDSDPTCKVENMKFFIGDAINSMAYDDLGATATDAVVRQIAQSDCGAELYEAWKRVDLKMNRGE